MCDSAMAEGNKITNSASKIKNKIETLKKRSEKIGEFNLDGLNPHSKGDIFSCSDSSIKVRFASHVISAGTIRIKNIKKKVFNQLI